jgi:hypothetical protein
MPQLKHRVEFYAPYFYGTLNRALNFMMETRKPDPDLAPDYVCLHVNGADNWYAVVTSMSRSGMFQQKLQLNDTCYPADKLPWSLPLGQDTWQLTGQLLIFRKDLEDILKALREIMDRRTFKAAKANIQLAVFGEDEKGFKVQVLYADTDLFCEFTSPKIAYPDYERHVLSAVKHLPEEKTVLQGRLFHGWTFAKIAEAFGNTTFELYFDATKGNNVREMPCLARNHDITIVFMPWRDVNHVTSWHSNALGEPA